ncbi:MAG: pyruvate kinase, partial [Planctomycetota bacterium]|jgi:pyruvate kinase
VRQGGVLSNRKGVNRRGGGLGAPALTAKDRADIGSAVRYKADYVAVSFVKSGDDVRHARDLVRAAGGHALLIAKIERAEAVEPEALADILTASDGIMVARGDLAVEVGDARVPALQKHLIRLARRHHKVVITATQMMESMVEAPVPTRAEVSDVANAVLDGTDAVMLSAESAVGKYPVRTVETMSRVCREAERGARLQLDETLFERAFKRIDQAIAMAALFTSSHVELKAIAALTESGATPLWMSRLNCGVPIYALTTQTATRYRVSLLRDVYPLTTRYQGHDRDALFEEAEAVLLGSGVAQKGDLIALTFGEPIGEPGGTNALKIIRIGEGRRP